MVIDVRGSYHKSLFNMAALFPHIIDVVEYVSMEREITRQKLQAKHILALMRAIDFVISLHLMIRH